MSETFAGDGTTGAIPYGRHKAGVLGAADLLCLAAAPTFAIMALLTGVLGGGQMATMCGAPQAGSLLGGMVPMYALMSVVHSAPWLKLIARRGRAHPKA